METDAPFKIQTNEEEGIKYPLRANLIRIAVAGDKGVGKTAFMKFVIFGSYDPFLKSALSTDFLTREIQVEDEKVIIQLWEVEPPTFNSIIIIYDITSRQSFFNAMKKLEEIRQKHGNELPILLLANKLDAESKRQVLSHEAEVAALRHQTMFSQISCIEGLNVRQSFIDFLQSMLTLHVQAYDPTK